uniref:Uncharacterized protein n=1 Tax=Picea sitchensis TaxID=3332 RepID=B8LP75_PICSI|nr:unknown [Picea sitchensis]
MARKVTNTNWENNSVLLGEVGGPGNNIPCSQQICIHGWRLTLNFVAAVCNWMIINICSTIACYLSLPAKPSCIN